MIIEYANGRSVKVEDEEDARRLIGEEYPDAVYGDWEEIAGERQRILVWQDEEDAGEPGTGDDGSNAVAEIVYYVEAP
ncbi:TPA_asm: hypothetical protein vir515_00012 [Caudoviricetes sp. vir515]|jgi:hypothetical protein|nr:TPA_asm: hypothetical protein vir515_00012 [Caudoviricetes sp. vir515]